MRMTKSTCHLPDVRVRLGPALVGLSQEALELRAQLPAVGLARIELPPLEGLDQAAVPDQVVRVERHGLATQAPRTVGLGHLADDVLLDGVRCQVSGVRYQVSGGRCQVSCVRCHVCGLRHLADDVLLDGGGQPLHAPRQGRAQHADHVEERVVPVTPVAHRG